MVDKFSRIRKGMVIFCLKMLSKNLSKRELTETSFMIDVIRFENRTHDLIETNQES
jgi:hypothetical protein